MRLTHRHLNGIAYLYSSNLKPYYVQEGNGTLLTCLTEWILSGTSKVLGGAAFCDKGIGKICSLGLQNLF